MVIPNLYEASTPNIVSVGLQDVATGKARTNLYAGILSQGYASGANILSGALVLSNVKFYSDAKVIAAENKTLNFDLDFGVSQTILGETIVQIPLYIGGGGAGSPGAFINIDFIKVNQDGSTTAIISGATRVAYNTDMSGMMCWACDFPLTIFKSKEKLRMKLRGEVVNGLSGYWIGCDPMNRDYQSVSFGIFGETNLIVQIPFRIDL